MTEEKTGATPESPEQQNDVPPSVRPRLVRLSEIKSEPVNFLWKPYIPLGKVTILGGDPGSGKSYFALWLVAKLSVGSPFFTGEVSRPPANAIYLTAEDGLEDTLRPRLEKLGAELSRVHSITGVELLQSRPGRRKGAVVPVTLDDLEYLDVAMREQAPVELVIIDPLQNFVGGQFDLNRVNQAAEVMARLKALAEKHKCALLIIRHLAKASGSKAIYRGLGSIGFTAAVRSEILLGHVGDQTPERSQGAIIQIKTNVGSKGAAMGYEITEQGFVVTGKSSATESDLQAPPGAADSFDEARDFLLDFLKDGPKPTKEVQDATSAHMINWRTTKRAFENLKKDGRVDVRRVSQSGATRGVGYWEWFLVEQSPEPREKIRDSAGVQETRPPVGLLEPTGGAPPGAIPVNQSEYLSTPPSKGLEEIASKDGVGARDGSPAAHDERVDDAQRMLEDLLRDSDFNVPPSSLQEGQRPGPAS